MEAEFDDCMVTDTEKQSFVYLARLLDSAEGFIEENPGQRKALQPILKFAVFSILSERLKSLDRFVE